MEDQPTNDIYFEHTLHHHLDIPVTVLYSQRLN